MEDKTLYNKQSFQGWKNLKKTQEAGVRNYTRSILSTGTCTNITYITLGFGGYNINDIYKKVHRLVNSLEYVPLIERLELSDVYISLKMLKSLKRNTPNLKELDLLAQPILDNQEGDQRVEDNNINNSPDVEFKLSRFALKSMWRPGFGDNLRENPLNELDVNDLLEHISENFTNLEHL